MNSIWYSFDYKFLVFYGDTILFDWILISDRVGNYNFYYSINKFEFKKINKCKNINWKILYSPYRNIYSFCPDKKLYSLA